MSSKKFLTLKNLEIQYQPSNGSLCSTVLTVKYTLFWLEEFIAYIIGIS